MTQNAAPRRVGTGGAAGKHVESERRLSYRKFPAKSPRKAASSRSLTLSQHCSAAKRDLAAGVSSLRSAAEHVAAAIALGATEMEVAAKVGTSQTRVNRLKKWYLSGFTKGGPWGADNTKKRKIIGQTNNWAQVEAKLLREISVMDRLRGYLQRTNKPANYRTRFTADTELKCQQLLSFVQNEVRTSPVRLLEKKVA